MPFNLIKSKIDEFNLTAGNLTPPVTTDRLLQQLAIIREEFNETYEAALAEDATELVDGIADMVVTVFGLFSLLELRGHDCIGATLAICDQNLEKFPTDPEVVQRTVEYYEEIGLVTSVEKLDGRFVIRNALTNKILKPVGFEKIDLSAFVAEV